jgi:hypothetical protein
MNALDPQSCVLLLSRCPELRHFQTGFATISSYLPSLFLVGLTDFSALGTIPSLQTLVLRLEDANTELDLLFNRITLPALKSLHIQGITISSNTPQSLEDLLLRSAAQLEILCLDLLPNPHNMMDLITVPSLRTVTSLDLKSSLVMGDDMVLALSNSNILPQLVTLEMYNCATSDGAISSMLASRMPPNRDDSSIVCPLKRVSVRYYIPAMSYEKDYEAFEHHANVWGVEITVVSAKGDVVVFRKGYKSNKSSGFQHRQIVSIRSGGTQPGVA